MRPSEHPQQYFDRYLDQAADRYVQGLKRAGLRPNARLTKAVAERAAREAYDGYMRQLNEARNHDIQIILYAYHLQMKTLKQESARLRLKVCLPLAALFGGLAWYSGTHSGFIAGSSLLFALGVGVLLAVIVLGAIFDRARL